MNDIQNFILGILSSIIGGIILLFIADKLSSKAKWILTGILSKLTNSDLDFVFENKAESNKDIEREIRRANEVYIFTSRGNELHRETFESIFINKPKDKKIKIRILLPDPTKENSGTDWINQRESELKTFDRAHGNGLLRSQIISNIEFLKRYIDDKEIELRLYDYPHIGRIIITDKFLFYTPYSSDTHGRNNSIYKFRSGGEMYKNFLRYFNQIWEQSRQVTDYT